MPSSNNVETMFVQQPVQHGAFSFTPHDCRVDVPLDSLPVDATEVSDGWRIIPPSPAFYPHETITFSHSFRDYVDLLPDYDAMIIQRVDFQGLDIYETYDALIASSSLLLVSNGGADNSIGSTGWIVSDATGRRLVQASRLVPGLNPISYRAEGYTMVSGLTVLKHISIICGRLTLPLSKDYTATTWDSSRKSLTSQNIAWPLSNVSSNLNMTTSSKPSKPSNSSVHTQRKPKFSM
jgi:hypothetical protein